MFLISTRNFPPDVGGIQNLMEGLANSLLNHGPVKVFADSFEGADVYDKNSKLNIERLNGFKIFKKYRKANLVNEFIQNNNVRAVFFDHWKSLEKIHSTILNKTNSFCLIHSKEINHPRFTSLNKRMINSFNKVRFIIANSNFTKELAVKNGIKEEKIKIINPGCNYPIPTDDFYKQKAEEIFKNSFPRIITIARLDRRKNHQNIFMTIKNLKPKYPNIKYVSIGNGEEKNNLESLKKELGLDNEIVFLADANEKFKIALIESSNLNLMPSIIHKKSVEGFGISFIETASYGKGSIGGDSGGEKDAIQDGHTGYICNGNDLNSIYETIIKFFDNDNYKILGLNAGEFSKKFKWSIIIKKYIELI